MDEYIPLGDAGELLEKETIFGPDVQSLLNRVRFQQIGGGAIARGGGKA